MRCLNFNLANKIKVERLKACEQMQTSICVDVAGHWSPPQSPGQGVGCVYSKAEDSGHSASWSPIKL